MTDTYQASWDSLLTHETPDWFMDNKFGLYAHWGLYAVPGFGNEWYGKWMYDPENEIHHEHIKRYGPLSKFGYKDFIPEFTAEHYDPDEWAELFQQSGAHYAGFSLAHHDGFGLWDSDVFKWNVGKMGPKRDLYGELATALRKRDIKLVAPFHILRTFNWFLPGWSQWEGTFNQANVEKGIAENWDLFDPEFADLYWVEQRSEFEPFIELWKAKIREVIDRYEPDLMWFDSGKFTHDVYANSSLEILAHYLNQSVLLNKEVCIMNKLAPSMEYNFHPEFGVINFEAGRDRPVGFDRPWNDDMKLGDQSWGWVKDQNYASAHTLLSKLIDSAARGGTFMLSVSPTADGRIPEDQQKPLLEMGEWLRTYGEAIQATRPWTTNAEGDTEKLIDRSGDHPQWAYENCNADDRRYTRSKDGKTVYAMTLGVPEASVTFEALDQSVSVDSVSMVASDQPVTWQQSDTGMTIDTQGVQFDSGLPVAWRITLNN